MDEKKHLTYSSAEVQALLEKAGKVGDPNILLTENKQTLVEAVNELFISASDGKIAIAAAITGKGVPTEATSSFADMAKNINDIPSTGGDIIVSGLTYVVGEPVAFALSGWDAAVQGTTYTLKANGYKIGANGLQIGLPSNSSTVNTQAVVAAALTIVDTAVTAPDTEKNVAGYVNVTISAVTVPDRDITVAIFGLEEAEPVTVTTTAIPGVSVPAATEFPVNAITETQQFTGAVEWTPKNNNNRLSRFMGETVYTATITLTPKPGYKLEGVASNFFTVEGASSVSNNANSGVVTAVFPATVSVPVSYSAINITVPKTGNTPAKSISAFPQFKGTVTWSPSDSKFVANTVYTATITLTAVNGYTLKDVSENFFTIDGATSVTNAANSNVVTAVFPAT